MAIIETFEAGRTPRHQPTATATASTPSHRPSVARSEPTNSP